jgi:hypothetical protein
MKNSQIHKGLDKKEIRDFLSTSLVKLFQEQVDNANKIEIPHTENPYEYSIKKLEQDIEYNTKQIEIYKGIQAVMLIIKMNKWEEFEMNKWEEFDVSDDTEKDNLHILKMNFIGTQKEYDFLLTKINGA